MSDTHSGHVWHSEAAVRLLLFFPPFQLSHKPAQVLEWQETNKQRLYRGFCVSRVIWVRVWRRGRCSVVETVTAWEKKLHYKLFVYGK